MDRAAVAAAVLGLALSLAGCGGGGGGGESSPSPVELVEITSGNAKTVAGAALASSLESGDLGVFAMPGASAFGVTSTKTATLYARVGEIQKAQTVALVKQSTAGYMQAAFGPQTTSCAAAGTVTVAGELASAQTLTAGDTVTMKFAACDDGTATVDGTFSMTISSFSGTLDSGAFSLGVAVELTDFQVSEDGRSATADGDFALTIDALNAPSVTLTLSSSSLSVVDGTESHALSDFTSTETIDQITGEYSLETSGTVESSAFDGAATFETIEPFVGSGAAHPRSGELRVTGAGGATLRVIALDTTFVRLALDGDGDGTADTTVDATWDELI